MFLPALLTALGLSGAAGLNAYVPLFLVGLMGRLGIIHLAAPYDAIQSMPVMLLLIVLLIVELIVDKIPGADHVNDIFQTFIRPLAGALLFASAAGVIKGLDPRIALAIGLVTALSVHGVKASARPVINATTLGLGASVVSTIEDIVALLLTIIAIFVPVLVLVFFAGIAWVLWRLIKRWRSPHPDRSGTFNKAYRRKRQQRSSKPPAPANGICTDSLDQQ